MASFQGTRFLGGTSCLYLRRRKMTGHASGSASRITARRSLFLRRHHSLLLRSNILSFFLLFILCWMMIEQRLMTRNISNSFDVFKSDGW